MSYTQMIRKTISVIVNEMALRMQNKKKTGRAGLYILYNPAQPVFYFILLFYGHHSEFLFLDIILYHVIRVRTENSPFSPDNQIWV